MVMKATLTGAAVAALLLASSPAVAAPAAKHYRNCTAMHQKYPHGVGKKHAHDAVSGSAKPVTTFKRSNALYAANKGSDRDHDGIACEKR